MTITSSGLAEPPGSVDYVTESISPTGAKIRHFVCRSCLELFDAPDETVTCHDCAGSHSSTQSESD